jgi:uncharacterized protein YndB with AHSA1/START domain
VAYTAVEIEASAPEVFAIIVDPMTYPAWLMGASQVDAVDERWPAPGSWFAHKVGPKPFRIADRSSVLEVEPNRMLRLAVRARPVISAVVTFRLVGEADRCVLTWEEEPAVRLLGNLVRPVADPLTHLRNQRSLRRLCVFINERQRRALDDATMAATTARHQQVLHG